MTAGWRVAGRVGLWLTLLLASAAGAAGAQPSTPESVVESQRRLEQIRRERAELRTEMTRIRSRVTDLSAELENVQRQVRTSAELLEELETQLARREEQIEQNARDLVFTRGQLAERRDVLNRRLREIYMRGPLQTLEVLLGADSFSDLLNRYRYLLQIARQDRRLADEVAALERQLVARERALRTYTLQLEGARRERETEVQELEGLRAQQGLALRNVRSREETAAGRLEELLRAEERLAGLMAELEAQRADAERTTTAGAEPAGGARGLGLSAGARGTLPWPVEGPILYGFAGADGGARRGVGIGAAAGTAVQAVAGGSVVLAEPFERYGPTVVVSHGGGFYTLYLRLANLRVREGDRVSAGQVVGTVGGGGTAEGPHLEFQLRTPGGEAVDPLPWLLPR